MNDAELATWTQLVSKATTAAMRNLSTMLGVEIDVGSFALKRVPLSQIANLVGGPEEISVGIYLGVSGSAEGQIMLMYAPQTACAFVDILMMQPEGTTKALGEMEVSALGEMGNVTGASFLNVLADAAGLHLMPSPPAVMTDMAGALLDVIAVDISLTQDHAFIAETTFTAPDRQVEGIFFVIPSQNLLQVLLDGARAA